MSEELTIAERRSEILSRIDKAAQSAGRAMSEVDFVAVSKQQSDDRVAAMLAAEQTVFGENRVQEATKRWGESFAKNRDQIELRLIGPLQSNKAAQAVALFDVIETLDREKLAAALVKAAESTGRMPRLYVQVNTGHEPQKAGVLPKDLPDFISTLRQDYNIHPEGLMSIPPVGEAASPHFWLLSDLAKTCGLEKLSMGMSADYETAVKMGATSVRIGSAAFGDR